MEQKQEAAEQDPLEEQQPAADADAKRRTKVKKSLKQELIEWVKAIIYAVVVVLLIRTFLFTIICVDGLSMYPTLNDGERLFATVLDVKLKGVERGDVVICHYPNRGNTYFVKRVVGVPGDVVRREAGVTYVNGLPVDPDGLFYQLGYDYDDYTLTENEYFCVGDNLYNSHDSRDWKDGDPSRDVGPITRDMITAKVWEVIWPLNEIRAVQ